MSAFIPVCLIISSFLLMTAIPCVIAFNAGWHRGWEEHKTRICEQYHR